MKKFLVTSLVLGLACSAFAIGNSSLENTLKVQNTKTGESGDIRVDDPHLQPAAKWGTSGGNALRSTLPNAYRVQDKPGTNYNYRTGNEACPGLVVTLPYSGTGDTSDNTDDGGSNASPDVWYQFTTGDVADVMVTLCNYEVDYYDTYLSVWTDECATEYAYNDDACGVVSELVLEDLPAGTYDVCVEGYSTNSGPYTIDIFEQEPATWPPAEYLVLNPLPPNDPYQQYGITHQTTGNTCEWTNLFDEVCPYTGSTAPEIPFQFVPDIDSFFDISLCNDSSGDPTDFDTKLYVYDDAQTLVGCNDDFCTSNTGTSYVSFLSVPLLAGNTYYIMVDGYGTACGNFNLQVGPAASADPTDPPPNDECADAIPITPPYPVQVTGTMDGATDSCTGFAAGDVWYTIELPYVSNTVVIDWCDDPTVWDNYGIVLSEDCNCTYIYGVYSSDCLNGNLILTFDNVVGPATVYFPHMVESYEATCAAPEVGISYSAGVASLNIAGADEADFFHIYKSVLPYTGFVEVDVIPAAPGVDETWFENAAGIANYQVTSECAPAPFIFNVDVTEVEPCDVECPPESVPEGEEICYDEYVDITNGGCNSDPYVFGQVDCEMTICGTSGTFLVQGSNNRDTDWFMFTLADPTTVTVTGESEFDNLFGVLTGVEDCLAPTWADQGQYVLGEDCVVESIAYNLYPGTYAVFFAPSVFEGVPCGAEYWFNMTCEPWTPPTAPPNDLCENAEAITGPYPVQVTGTLEGATVDCAGLLDWNAVWYTIDLPYGCNDLTIDWCDDPVTWDNYGIIYMDDCLCDDYVAGSYGFTCANGNLELSFPGVVGPATIYLPLYVQDYDGIDFDFIFNVDIQECAGFVPPVDPILIDVLPYQHCYTTVGGVHDYDEVCPYSGSLSEDVEYEFTPGADAEYYFTLCNDDVACPTDYDTKLYLYDEVGNLVICVDDACTSNTGTSYVSEFQVALTGGSLYYLIVDGYGSAAGNYNLQVSELDFEYVDTQPVHGPDDSWSFGTSHDNGLDVNYYRADRFGMGGNIDEVTIWGLSLIHDGTSFVACDPTAGMDLQVDLYAEEGLGVPGTLLQSEMVTVMPTPTGILYADLYELYELVIPVTPYELVDGWVGIQSYGDELDCWLLWGSASIGNGSSYTETDGIPQPDDTFDRCYQLGYGVPLGDTCAEPYLVSALPYNFAGDLTDNTETNGLRGIDEFHQFVAPADGDYRITLCDGDVATFDTYMYLFADDCATQIAYNDDFCSVVSEIDVVTLTSGTTYNVSVECYSTSTTPGPYELNITGP